MIVSNAGNVLHKRETKGKIKEVIENTFKNRDTQVSNDDPQNSPKNILENLPEINPKNILEKFQRSCLRLW